MHGGKSPGAPKGNRNALKHGLYTAEAIANRRKVGALLRAVRQLLRQADDCGTTQAGGHQSPRYWREMGSHELQKRVTTVGGSRKTRGTTPRKRTVTNMATTWLIQLCRRNQDLVATFMSRPQVVSQRNGDLSYVKDARFVRLGPRFR
jgi:hypothetical protein